MATNPRMGKVNTKMTKPGKWDSMQPKAGKALPKVKAPRSVTKKEAEPGTDAQESTPKAMPKGKAPRSVSKKESEPKTGASESTPKSTSDRKPGSGRAM